jgi:hypothetical protein
MINYPYMSEINIFGKKLPEYIKKSANKTVGEQHESSLEQMRERILHDAKIVQGFITRLDTLTAEMGLQEIIGQLNEEKEKAFSSVPNETRTLLNRWIEASEKLHMLQTEKLEDEDEDEDEDDEEDFDYEDEVDDEESEYARLEKESNAMYEELSQYPSFQTFYNIEIWARSMTKAAEEVGAWGQNEKKVLQAVNNTPFLKNRKITLTKKQIMRIHFEPFCVQYEVEPVVFDKLWTNPQDVRGFYIPKTHFAFILAKKKSTRERRPFKRKVHTASQIATHESGHRMLDATHVQPGEIISRINTRFGIYKRGLELGMASNDNLFKESLREVFRNAVNATQNEFLAELNVARSLPGNGLLGWYWTTAESIARTFVEEVSPTIKSVEESDKEFAEELHALAKRVYPRFIQAKACVINGLRIAQYIDKKQASAYVTALAFVMPVHSYKHIEKMLIHAYGDQSVTRARGEVFLEDIQDGRKIPSLQELSHILALVGGDKEGGRVMDWYEILASDHERYITEWMISSFTDLKECIEKMKQWPARFISDSRSNPMEEISYAFFSKQIDRAVKSGGISCLPSTEELIGDALMQKAFFRALQVTFDAGCFEEDLGEYLKKEEVTREDILASPVAQYCKEAGLEAKFLACVDDRDA